LDPLSQGVLGGSASLSFSKKSHIAIAALCGILAGMSPDLDILIKSDTDPLLYLEYHRQFTHSLIFIPLGGLICAGVFYFTFSRRLGFLQTYIYSVAGYATHALLDSCTTYGTQLFWPFSNMRIAWHNISIIDPLFTIPILLFVALGVFKKSRMFGMVAIAWAVGYLLLGAWQSDRARYYGEQLAQSRGHQPVRLEAKPSFGNLLVWKVIYEANQHYYVDAVRVGLTSSFYEGQVVPKLSVERDLPWLNEGSQQAKDLERFRWFSNDYLALGSGRQNYVIDMRYSLLPNEVSGMWGIQLNPQKDDQQHVDFVWSREARQEKQQTLLKMIFGRQSSTDL